MKNSKRLITGMISAVLFVTSAGLPVYAEESVDTIDTEETFLETQMESELESEIYVTETVQAETESDTEEIVETEYVLEETEIVRTQADASGILYSGKSGDLNWSIDSAGHFKLWGSGDYEFIEDDWGYKTLPWCEHSEEISSAEIAVDKIMNLSGMLSWLSLEKIDISKLNTSSVIDMSYMFNGCSIADVDFKNFNTSRVANMEGMFYCSDIQNLDLINFDTSQVKDMSFMFYGGPESRTINLSSFDTKNVENMALMFSYSTATKLDLKHFDTSKVKNMEYMFFRADYLENLDLSNFNTSNVVDMQNMFNMCESLTSLDVSNFDTRNVTNVTRMFQACDKLTLLDLSSFDLSNVTKDEDAEGMLAMGLFEGTILHTLYTPKNVKVNIELPVPANGSYWRDIEGNVYTHLPKNLNKSILLTTSEISNTYEVNYDANGGKYAPLSQVKIENIALNLNTIQPSKSYQITYDANGGTVNEKQKTVDCMFTSWNTQKDGKGTSYESGGKYTADKNVTLYAQWINPKAGQLITPTRNEYVFDGWYTAKTGGKKVTSSTVITQDMTVYAHWRKSQVAYEGVDAFVAQLYNVCLNRDPDEAGLKDWSNKLTGKQIDGVTAAYGFIFSPEFLNKNLCNEDYVKQMYSAFLGRTPDKAGLADWVGQLDSGKTREEIFNGFALSQEFKGLCEKYGINQGSGIEVPEHGIMPNGKCSICGKEDGVTGFVKRLYKVCLNREADAGGLADWTGQLRSHTATGRSVAYGFIFSQEFINKKYNNADYIEHLYEAFMGRGSDAGGKADWLNRMNKQGWTREQVFDGFVGSQEFTGICNSYGIKRD